MKTLIRTLFGMIPPAIAIIMLELFGVTEYIDAQALGLTALACFVLGAIYAVVIALFLKGISSLKTLDGQALYQDIKDDEEIIIRMAFVHVFLIIILASSLGSGLDLFMAYGALGLIYSCLRHWGYLIEEYDEQIEALKL